MVGISYDFLANPLGAVQLTFQKAVDSGSGATTLDDRDRGAADLFRQFLFDDGGLSQGPDEKCKFFEWVDPETCANEEWQKREAWYAVKMEEVESKNADLRKKNKVLKDKVGLEKWKVTVLASMVLAMVATVVMFFCGEGMWKKKWLALP